VEFCGEYSIHGDRMDARYRCVMYVTHALYVTADPDLLRYFLRLIAADRPIGRPSTDDPEHRLALFAFDTVVTFLRSAIGAPVHYAEDFAASIDHALVSRIEAYLDQRGTAANMPELAEKALSGSGRAWERKRGRS
jgi:hypothetical protein